MSLLVDLGREDRREEAWTAFHSRYCDLIHGWCRRRGASEEEAKDLTQDVLLKLFRRIRTYDPTKSRFRGWLMAVVNNAKADWVRGRQRRLDVDCVGGTAFLDQMVHRESTEDADDLSGLIEGRMLSTFDEVCARVKDRVEIKTWQAFYQTMVNGRPATEVAAELGLKVGSVFKYKLRVKEMLVREYCDGLHDD
jgi:RNA polymerase sigma-70 factor (ECF subfamily)